MALYYKIYRCYCVFYPVSHYEDEELLVERLSLYSLVPLYDIGLIFNIHSPQSFLFHYYYDPTCWANELKSRVYCDLSGHGSMKETSKYA